MKLVSTSTNVLTDQELWTSTVNCEWYMHPPPAGFIALHGRPSRWPAGAIDPRLCAIYSVCTCIHPARLVGISWKYDVMSKIHLLQSMRIYVKNNRVKFYPDPIWNNGVLDFFLLKSVPQPQQQACRRRRRRWWWWWWRVAIWDQSLLQKCHGVIATWTAIINCSIVEWMQRYVAALSSALASCVETNITQACRNRYLFTDVSMDLHQLTWMTFCSRSLIDVPGRWRLRSSLTLARQQEHVQFTTGSDVVTDCQHLNLNIKPNLFSVSFLIFDCKMTELLKRYVINASFYYIRETHGWI